MYVKEIFIYLVQKLSALCKCLKWPYKDIFINIDL